MLTLPADIPAGLTPADSIIYVDIRCNSHRPDTGEALSWFDNVGIIEWTEWSALTTPLSVTKPNDFYYIQLRTPTETSGVSFSYTESAYGPTPLPIMSVNPRSFELLLNPEATTTAALTVGNSGGARLDFTVTPEAEWFYPDRWTGTVEPYADSVITLTFDAGGLGEGTYESQLVLRSDDPGQSLLFLPIQLTVTMSPIVTVSVTPGGDSIVLSWPPVPGAIAYNIYRSEAPNGPWLSVSVESATGYTDENAVLLFEQAYYQVTAELPTGTSGKAPLGRDSQTDRSR
jgi:hypothetical protein